MARILDCNPKSSLDRPIRRHVVAGGGLDASGWPVLPSGLLGPVALTSRP